MLTHVKSLIRQSSHHSGEMLLVPLMAGQVAGGEDDKGLRFWVRTNRIGHSCSLSNHIVTGPEFNNSTCIYAPKTPPATFTPKPATASLKRSTSGSASAGGAASV